MTYHLTLTSAQTAELIRGRDRHPKPYVRERASAMLQIAAGDSPTHVAEHGLLKHRDHETVLGWLRRYQDEGFDGLVMRPGRGRKPRCFRHPS